MNPSRPNDRLEYALLTAWVETADIGLCVADDNGYAVMLNSAGCRHLGIAALSGLDRSLGYLFREFDDPVRLLGWVESTCIDDGLQVSRRHQAGTVCLLLKKQIVEHLNGECFTMLSFTDVTVMLEAQQRIAEQAQDAQMKRQWQALYAGVVIVDALLPDKPILYVNAMFEQMSGYSAAEVVGRNCKFLQADEVEQPALADLRYAIKTQTNGYAVLRNYRKDGSLFINELFISPIRNSEGRVIQFIGIQHLRASA